MILRQATIKYKGYDPDELKPQSHKRICKSCDQCGRVGWVPKSGYKDICHPCSLLINDKFNASGKDHPNYGKHLSNKTKEKMSKSLTGIRRTDEQKKNYSKSKMGDKNPQYGMTGELSHNFDIPKTLECRIIRSCQEQGIEVKDFNGFIGRHPKNRSYALIEEKCIKMNDKFKGSHFHHITKSMGIYIPGELHNHIKHNMRTGSNMGNMNMLALQFINGGL